MNLIPKSLSRQRLLFLIAIAAIYTALVVWLDFLQGPYWWDERIFWNTSLEFSDRLVPTLGQLKDYNELNTPLPFIAFGGLEYLFNQGIWTGRFFNLLLSLWMVFIVGWPTKSKDNRAIACLIGLFLCPYYLWLSGRLYTEMIACFWVIVGFYGYLRNRHVLSCIAFILAIASRQYMLAFPAAVFVYEVGQMLITSIHQRRVVLAQYWRWLSPLIAALSILGWFYLFQGMTPQSALEVRPAPDIQRAAWVISPGGAINFLAFVGLYLVIPEGLLFRTYLNLFSWHRHRTKVILIAIALLAFLILFPPLLVGSGSLLKLVGILPHDSLKLLLLYSLALLACIRFSQANLISIVVFVNAIIMTKAYPWDRYVLPLAVAFWYLKVHRIDQRYSLFKQREQSLLSKNMPTTVSTEGYEAKE